jgi:hypothetical protein
MSNIDWGNSVQTWVQLGAEFEKVIHHFVTIINLFLDQVETLECSGTISVRELQLSALHRASHKEILYFILNLIVSHSLSSCVKHNFGLNLFNDVFGDTCSPLINYPDSYMLISKVLHEVIMHHDLLFI